MITLQNFGDKKCVKRYNRYKNIRHLLLIFSCVNVVQNNRKGKVMSNDILIFENINNDFIHFNNGLAIHYHIKDELHVMDAKTHNICDANIISIIELISDVLRVNIKLDIVARNEGGIRDIILFRPKTKKGILVFKSIYAPLLVGLILFLVSFFLTRNPEEDSLQIQIKKAKLELLIAQKQQLIEQDKKDEEVLDHLKKITDNISNLTQGQIVKKIRRKQSVVYKQLEGDKNVVAFSVEQNTEEYIELGKVNQCDFHNFIIEASEQITEYDEDATIEIVSPVLNNSNIKWKGIYNGDVIDFYMKDKEFKQQILNNNLQFGCNNILSAILEIKKKINEYGEEETPIFSVITVLGTEHQDGYIETPKGKQYRENPKQLSFAFDNK